MCACVSVSVRVCVTGWVGVCVGVRVSGCGMMVVGLSLLPGPVFLQRLVALLTSEVLSNAMVSRALAALKEEWMK